MRNWLGAAVQVTGSDFWFTEMRAGRCFFGGDQIFVPVNAQAIALFNPVGSGVEALVYAVDFGGAVVNGILLSTITADLTTNVHNGTNCLLGGAAAACHISRQDVAATPGTLVSAFPTGARATTPGHQAWMFELPPGKGVCLTDGSTGEGLPFTFWWREGG